jgi:hypothetical protein
LNLSGSLNQLPVLFSVIHKKIKKKATQFSISSMFAVEKVVPENNLKLFFLKFTNNRIVEQIKSDVFKQCFFNVLVDSKLILRLFFSV